MKDNSFEELKAGIEANIPKNQDNFTRNELLGRGLFASFLKLMKIELYQFTEGKFDKVDCLFRSNRIWEVEIKVRSDSAEGYSTLFLEVSKLKAMIALIQNHSAEEGIYINFIQNKAYIFNIKTICKALKQHKIYISTRYCNRTTAEEAGKVDKRMLEIPKQLAAEYEYIEGKWAKVRP